MADSTRTKQPSGAASVNRAPAFLWIGSAVLLAAALGLALGPKFAPQLAGPVGALAGMGLSGGLCGACALVFAGLALAAAARAPAPSSAGETERFAERVAAELGHLRAAIEQQRLELTALQHSGMGTVVAAPSSEQLNAMFRIAASMDQLGAKLDTGFNKHLGTLEARFDALTEAVIHASEAASANTAQALAQVQQAVVQGAPPAAAPAPQFMAQPPRARPAAAPMYAESSAPAQPESEPAPEPEAPREPRMALGVLDHISDDGDQRPPNVLDLDAQPAPMPRQEREATGSGSGLDLLPDDRVRRALGR